MYHSRFGNAISLLFMKVGIYNSSRENFGIGNTSAAILANEMAKKFDVELVANSGSATREEFEQLAGSSLARVAFRTIDDLRLVVSDPDDPVSRYQLIRTWSDELTHRYDLFINFADRWPIFCSASQGVLVVQSPRDFIPPVYRTFWGEHLASYQLKLAYSYYTRFWTKVFWEVDCPVVYPPAPFQPSSAADKEDLIVTVGPIDPLHHQLELILAFIELNRDLAKWSLVVMGEFDQHLANRKYLAKLEHTAKDLPVSFLPNPSAQQKLDFFRRSKILWSATGMGCNLELRPQPVEPFCIDVVQAMAAGCVPLATNSGSLPEVIRHRESGIFWDTIEELQDQTLALAQDEIRRQSISKESKERARTFSSEKFTGTFLRELKAAFGIRSHSLVSPSSLWKRLVRSADQLLVARR